MEHKINNIIKLLAIKEDDKDKSCSIFDGNDNNLYAKGAPKVTASEGAAIRQCITSPWKKAVLLKVNEIDYLCVKVSNILIGKGNFTKDTSSRISQAHLESNFKDVDSSKISGSHLGCGLKGGLDDSKSSQNDSDSYVKEVLADAKSEKNKSSEILGRETILTAMCVEDLTITLIGHKVAVAEDPLLKQIKDVAKILANTNSQEVAAL